MESSFCKEIWKTRLLATPTNIRLSSILVGTDERSSLLYLSANYGTKKVATCVLFEKYKPVWVKKHFGIFSSKKTEILGAMTLVITTLVIMTIGILTLIVTPMSILILSIKILSLITLG